MRHYIGVKMVQAEEMERDDRPGYRVVYPDGYESWSPKDVFEKAYLPLADATKISAEDVTGFMAAGKETTISLPDGKTTLVGLTLPTGWVEYVSSTCVSPENYDEDLGRRCALETISDRLWKHLGFVLQWARKGFYEKIC